MSNPIYISFRSGKGNYNYYHLETTRSDRYDNERVKRYDRKLNRALSEIFHERRLSKSQMKQLLRSHKKKKPTGGENSIFKLILEREPRLGKLLLHRDELSLLWIAVLSCYQDSAELLVRSGADVNETYGLDRAHWSRSDRLTVKSSLLHALLHMYPSSWNDRFVGLLLDHGAELLEARDSHVSTALHLAVRKGRLKVAQMLLERGADVDAAHFSGTTPLHEAARSSQVDELLPLLTRHGANIKARDPYGRNALYYLASGKANESKKIELARVLIEKGVSPREIRIHSEDPQPRQPIHAAVSSRGNNELVNLFLDHGANVNARTVSEEFPLYIAAQECANPAVLLTLLKRGANIDMIREAGDWTALHAMTVYDRFCWRDKNTLDKMKVLLSFGADMFSGESYGYHVTPFDVICQKNDKLGNPCLMLALKTLALKKACLQQPASIELKGESVIKEKYPKMWNRYQKCVKEVNRTKFTKLTKNHTLFELLTECQCRIAPLMRNREFESEFRLCDLSVFSRFQEDILDAFERAERYHRSVLEQENLISEAFYNTLPYMVVRKVVRYMHECEICEIKKTVNASRYINRYD